MSRYTHPVFVREEAYFGVSQFSLDGNKVELQQGSTQGYEKFYDNLEEFFKDLESSEKLRVKIGIPQMSYHAFGFPRLGYDTTHIRNLIEWARKHNHEVRAWINWESALLLIVIADLDMSENSGWKLYQYVQQNAKSYQSYGLSSWFEFCKFGVPIPDDWHLIEKGNLLFASSPNGKQFVTLGA